MKIKLNKEPGIVLTLTEEEAIYLKAITHNGYIASKTISEFRKKLGGLLTKVGVKL